MSSFAVIFDMDGVLVDSNPYHKTALVQFCRKHGYELTEEQLREKIFGRTNRNWIMNLFGNLPEEQIALYAAEKESLFRDIYKDAIEPVGGLIAFLNLLNQHEVPRAIATSAPRANVDFTLSKTGIGKYFQTILDDTFVTRGKPDPEIYIKAARALGLSPSKCIVIEDSLSGIAAAKAAGTRVIGISTTHSADEMTGTDLVIRDFHYLTLQQLKEIAGAG